MLNKGLARWGEQVQHRACEWEKNRHEPVEDEVSSLLQAPRAGASSWLELQDFRSVTKIPGALPTTSHPLANSGQGDPMAGRSGTSAQRGRPPTSPRSRGRAQRGRSLDSVSLGQVDSSDQVSLVSVTNMEEELETQEEEILSMDMGHGSLHEIDETLVPEENGLQIVPWEIRDEITYKCQDRIRKLLNIPNPNLGTDWLANVLSLKWADKITRGAYGLKKGDHVFRIWPRREGFLARVFERAFHIVSDLMDVPVSLGAKTKDVEKQALKKVDTLRMGAQRLTFRFFMLLVSKNVIPAMPFLARQWTQMAAQDTCMYPSSMCIFSPWEIKNCPCWIDIEKRHVFGCDNYMRRCRGML
ncbi:hypothetical protein GOP47_0014747 [Adiantum capillus-veneris]|uniref:Uncharacterized protein n=1 Tax=Adiantum capillus-veneris TaxID=13818 RepID=A0A9D4ZCR8_ADICA|nr:hypothetical protein GOP47_0014747 [Adiantum capillus-veneris]